MITVRMLGSHEASLLRKVASDVFDGPVRENLAAEFAADPRHHLAVALDAGERVVGMASAVHYAHPDKPPQLFINEVGVASPVRGRGVGKRLLAAVLERGRELGCSEAWVVTESGNAAAKALYHSAGGRKEAEPAVLFTFPLGETAE